jgi:hypothetical protein
MCLALKNFDSRPSRFGIHPLLAVKVRCIDESLYSELQRVAAARDSGVVTASLTHLSSTRRCEVVLHALTGTALDQDLGNIAVTTKFACSPSPNSRR